MLYNFQHQQKKTRKSNNNIPKTFTDTNTFCFLVVFLALQKWSCIGKWLVPHLPKGCKGIVWCRMRPAPLSLGDTKGSYSSSSFSSWSAWNKYCKEPKPTDFSSYIQRRHCGEVESAHLHMKVFKMCVYLLHPCFPPPDGCTALLRHMGGFNQTLMKCTSQLGKSQM